MSTITPSQTLANAALERIAAATAGHEPGQPYYLTLEQFHRFWYELHDDKQTIGVDFGNQDTLWRTICLYEHDRWFLDSYDYCSSKLNMTTDTGGLMQWWYKTTSETQLFALDWRSQKTPGFVSWDDVLHPFDEVCKWDPNSLDPENPWARVGPDGLYAIIIPEERDHACRTAWTQVRMAIANFDYRNWHDEYYETDEVAIARKLVKTALKKND
jgi:hypothetical protein